VDEARQQNYNSIMSDRSQLHKLVDGLPEAALAVAQGALEHFQSWPPQEPEQLRAMRQAGTDRMRRSMRPGTGGAGGGGGSYRMGPSGRIEYGHHSHSHWEDDAVVVMTHRFHAGHELVIEERLRLEDSGTTLMYVHLVTGPDGRADRREITFGVEKK
jgi:hypothetical protein